MANIKSQKKRIRTNEEARQRNRSVRSELKTAEGKLAQALEAGDKEAATVAMLDASQLLDKAVSKGVVPKNRAANHKSRMATDVNGLDG